MEVAMKALNLITLMLIIVGGLNWGLVGAFELDFVSAIFGGDDAAGTRIVYVLVGVSALYQLIPLAQAFSVGEVFAEGARQRY
jgi:uncharacterized membrane protein YuzA (DUF378 family)